MLISWVPSLPWGNTPHFTLPHPTSSTYGNPLGKQIGRLKKREKFFALNNFEQNEYATQRFSGMTKNHFSRRFLKMINTFVCFTPNRL